jgi:hypothetical protein
MTARSDPLPHDMRERAGISNAKANGKASVEVGRFLSTVEPERVGWIWRGRIPKGKLTIIEGDPSDGKSTMTIDMAARKSMGRPWPDGEECEAGGVVLCNAEDGLADTIRPRLDAAGGDPERVLALVTVPDGDSERLLSIPKDLEFIRRGIERVGAAMVVFDPLSAFLSGNVNTHRDADVRRALAPMAKLAEDTGAAVVVVRHLNQTQGGNPLYRGQGSIGIVGAARSALLLARHPEDEDLRVLASLKSNLARPAPSLTFALVESDNGSARVDWRGETPLSAAALLAAPADPAERSALEEAMEFLRDELASGPVWSEQVKEDADAADIAVGTLKRAKSKLRIRSKKQSDGTWTWEVPEEDHRPRNAQDDPLDPLPAGKPAPGQQGEEQGDHDDPLARSQDSRAAKPDPQSEGEQGAQGDQGDQGLGHGTRRPSAEEERRIRNLTRQGVSPRWARLEVLGDLGL